MRAANGRFRRNAVVTVVAGILLLATMGVAGCGEKEASGGPMKVAASIAPLADFCRQVGGGLVEVELMVPPGASPHTYEPTASQMKFLSDAEVLVLNGLELETWVADVVRKADNPELVEVVAGESVPESNLIEAVGEHGLYDPHVWLDPKLAIHEVEAIRDGFIEADPANRQAYTDNADRYMRELVALDGRIKKDTAAFTRKAFVAFHPSFTYYARRYGLDQVGVIEELPGKEPGAGEIADIIEKIKESGATVVLAEPQFSPKVAETIAAEADVGVVTVDPLGDPDNPATNTYVKLMEYGTRELSKAME